MSSSTLHNFIVTYVKALRFQSKQQKSPHCGVGLYCSAGEFFSQTLPQVQQVSAVVFAIHSISLQLNSITSMAYLASIEKPKYYNQLLLDLYLM